MFRFEFIDTSGDRYARKVCLEYDSNDAHIEDVFAMFRDFMCGVGYVVKGDVGIIDDAAYSLTDLGAALAKEMKISKAADTKECSGKCCGSKPDKE